MLRARSVSATTSVPQPGAFSGVSLTGRSSSRIEGWARFFAGAAAGAALADAVVTGQSLGSGEPQEAHRTGSARLAQPRQERHPGIAVGGRHPDLALEIAYRAHGVVADAAVGARDARLLPSVI